MTSRIIKDEDIPKLRNLIYVADQENFDKFIASLREHDPLCMFDDTCARSSFNTCIFCDENFKNKERAYAAKLSAPAIEFTDEELTHIEHTLAKRPYRELCPMCTSIGQKIAEIRERRSENKDAA